MQSAKSSSSEDLNQIELSSSREVARLEATNTLDGGCSKPTISIATDPDFTSAITSSLRSLIGDLTSNSTEIDINEVKAAIKALKQVTNLVQDMDIDQIRDAVTLSIENKKSLSRVRQRAIKVITSILEAIAESCWSDEGLVKLAEKALKLSVDLLPVLNQQVKHTQREAPITQPAPRVNVYLSDEEEVVIEHHAQRTDRPKLDLPPRTTSRATVDLSGCGPIVVPADVQSEVEESRTMVNYPSDLINFDAERTEETRNFEFVTGQVFTNIPDSHGLGHSKDFEEMELLTKPLRQIPQDNKSKWVIKLIRLRTYSSYPEAFLYFMVNQKVLPNGISPFRCAVARQHGSRAH